MSRDEGVKSESMSGDAGEREPGTLAYKSHAAAGAGMRPVSPSSAVSMAWAAIVMVVAGGGACAYMYLLPGRLSEAEYGRYELAELLWVTGWLFGGLFGVLACARSPYGSRAGRMGFVAGLLSVGVFLSPRENHFCSGDARRSGATASVQTIRAAVAAYKLQHNGRYPTSDGTPAGAWDWSLLPSFVPQAGNPAFPVPLPPYNPYNNSTSMGTALGTAGWIITPDGKIHASNKEGTGFVEE